jgi:uncharacterized membrane protein YfcA
MLPIEIIIILIILMFFVSFLYSNIGLGGGTLYVPIMVFVAISMDRLEIIPVSLFLSFMTQLPAAYKHYEAGFVDIKLGFLLMLATIPGVVIGVLIGIRTTDVFAYVSFSILLFVTAVKMTIDLSRNKFEHSKKDKEHAKNRLVLVFFISICSGIVSAFFGVGGGIITVPVLIYILDIYPRKAIGTSAFMIIFTSIVGFICYGLLSANLIEVSGIALRTIPNIPYELAVILGVVVFIGAYFGSSWGLKSLKTKSVQAIFVLVIIIVGIQLLLRALGFI